MGSNKRPFGVAAGPIIFVIGLGVIAGANKVQSLKAMVHDWGDQLEHSAEPVTMDLPVWVPLYVSGDRLGRLDAIQVLRDRPGAVDSLALHASLRNGYDAELEGCALRLRVPNGDIAAFKHALRCVNEVDGLVSFGTLHVANRDVPIYVDVDDLPCEHRDVHIGACSRVRSGLEHELRRLGDELRRDRRQVQDEARRLRDEIRVRVRTDVRDKVRASIR